MDTANRTRTSREEPAPPVVEYSGIVTRGVAFVVDAVIVNGVAIVTAGAAAIVISLFPGTHKLHALEAVIAAAVFVVWSIAYFATFWATTGQTPGDRVMQIRVTRADGSPLHATRAIARVGATVLASLPLFAGFLPIALTERRRGLNDWLVDTVVTHVPPEMPADLGLSSRESYEHDGAPEWRRARRTAPSGR
jgi:uncharacterized RDD family membrane protein YckC